MKKLTLITFLIACLGACKKDNVVENSNPSVGPTQEVELSYNKSLKPIVFEFTSTGCPGCGSWGKPTFYSIINEFENKVTPVAVHIKYGDPMITLISNEIAANRYGQLYTPQIWVNDTNAVQLVNGMISSQASIEYMRHMINNSTVQDLVFIDGKIIEKSGSKSELKIGIKSKSLNESKEYFLSCYLMQDGISNHQSGYTSNPATHNHVIRATSNTTWGNKVFLENQKFEETVSFESEFVNQNHYYTLILWQKDNTRFIPLGGLVIK